MSLIAWYPLNGDTEDYGGNGNSLILRSSGGKIVESLEGKIGECLERKTLNDSPEYLEGKNEIFLSGDFTFACWAFVSVCHAGTANGLVSNHSHSHNTGAGITVKHVSDTDFRVSCNTGSGTSRTYHSYYGTTNIKDKWSHLVMRYDSKAKLVSLWVNGVKEKEVGYTMVTRLDKLTLFNWSTTYTSAAYRPASKLNDVRVYDHALSPKEIKEIVKAKVLHYKFDPYEEPTTNLITNPTKEVTSATSEFIQFTDLAPIIERKGLDTVYSLSFDIKSKDISNYNKIKVYLQNGSGSRYSFPSPSVSVTSDYERHTVEGINFSLQNTGTSQAMLAFYGVYGTGNIPSVKNVQLEEKDHATPFTIGTRQGTIRDCSGFRNDGTVAATTAPSWSEDTPIGSGSMEFDGSLITAEKIFYDNEQTHTVSAWVKPTSSNSSKLINFHNGYSLSYSNGRTLMYMNGGVNDHYVYGSKLTENKWTHVTWVYDKSNLRCQVYYDGVLHTSSSNFDVNDVPSGFGTTTVFGAGFVGNISDVRIYATALAPEDILELYQTRASIDNAGNLHTYEFDEVNGDTSGISSQGVANFTSINEVGRPIRYIRDYLNGSTSNTGNHWVEIKAIDLDGDNVALRKGTGTLTDGNTNTTPYYSKSSGLQSVTIDLGSVHNVEYLQVWHYYGDNRTYHETKTQVSSDGVNWITLFDSSVEGEYQETSKGRKYLLTNDKVSISQSGDLFVSEITEI